MVDTTGMSTAEISELVAEMIASKIPVKIRHNDETGKEWWSVCSNEDPEFWLDSFDEKQDAIDFCEKNGLPITEIVDELDPTESSPGLEELEETGNKLSDDEAIQALKDLMNRKGMTELCGMVVLNWRVYAIIRQEMERACGIALTPELFSALLQGLSTTSMQPFSIVDLKKDLKHRMMPWIAKMCAQRTADNKQVKRKKK